MQGDSKEAEIISLDIVGFSKMTSEQQLIIVENLTNMTRININTKFKDKFKYVPNGDGFHIIIEPGLSVIFSLILKKIEIFLKNKYSFFDGCRICVINGSYFTFKNMLGNESCMGEGISEAEEITADKKIFYRDIIIVEEDLLQDHLFNFKLKFSHPFKYKSNYSI